MKNVLLFDCDGVLGDTEQYGHLIAFNQMWKELQVPWQWSEAQYGEKLKIGGGKERMASLFNDDEFLAVFTPPETPEEREALIKKWHLKKTELYKKIIASGSIPGRPGVKRLCEEALSAGWTLGVCSTSKLESVEAVLVHAVGKKITEQFELMLAGDVVKAKKPAPDIYQLAAERLGASPAQCVVVEDSRNGMLAAVGADMTCIVTVSSYTRDEDFTGAALVVTCLGDPKGEPCEVLANRAGLDINQCVTIEDLAKL